MSVRRVDRLSAISAPRREDLSFPRRREAAGDLASVLAKQNIRRALDGLEPGAGRPLPPEIAFLSNHGVPLVVLQYGAALARRQGASADAVLLAERLVPEERFYRALAEELGVPYLDSSAMVKPSANLAADAERGYARLAANSHALRWLIAPRGDQISHLVGVARTTRGRPLFALASPASFSRALRRASGPRLAREAAYAVERRHPNLAVRPSLRRDLLAWTLCANALLIVALLSPVGEIALPAALVLAALFLVALSFRFYVAFASFRDDEPAPASSDADLPIYSVVVALYKEASVALQLTRAIDRLDYPRAKLDVKFVVECDDGATAAALEAARPRFPCEIIVAPPGAPKTKPRALNVAMPFLRGSLVVVFDAEDLPEPDQLRKVAAEFARAPREVVCYQAALCIHNGARNWMTALFAIDYAALFQVFNKGAASARLPFFLGGSSNHFRVESLRDIGFWDAFNVTEDADLGLRLARCGYESRTLLSRTYEEAPTDFAALLRQRSRWFKGWMQTALVHCRDPRAFFSDLGFVRAIAVLAAFAGGLLGPLFAPFFLLNLSFQSLSGRLLAAAAPDAFSFMWLWCLVAASGFVLSLWPKILAVRRAGLPAPWLPLICSPLWSLMLTLAAWRALRDLWLRPYYWDKTEHRPLARRRTPPPQANSHCLSENPELSVLR